jgi:hypothetical protein
MVSAFPANDGDGSCNIKWRTTGRIEINAAFGSCDFGVIVFEMGLAGKGGLRNRTSDNESICDVS